MSLLSICIPTFERKDDLEHCLQSIFSLDANILNKIEVCISDNCSNYDFNAMMMNYSNYNNLTYKINDENIGFDNNMLETLKMANGKYVMFLGNDDLIIMDGIAELIKILEFKEPDAVFSNYKIANLDTGKSHYINNSDILKEDLMLKNIFKILKEKITFISSITIKNIHLKFNNDFKIRYTGKNFIHIAFVLEALKNSSNIVYLPTPTALATNKNKTSYNVKHLFLYDLGFIINSYNDMYDDITLKPLRAGILAHVFFSMEKIYLEDLIQFRFVNMYSIFLLILSKNSFVVKIYRKIQLFFMHLFMQSLKMKASNI